MQKIEPSSHPTVSITGRGGGIQKQTSAIHYGSAFASGRWGGLLLLTAHRSEENRWLLLNVNVKYQTRRVRVLPAGVGAFGCTRFTLELSLKDFNYLGKHWWARRGFLPSDIRGNFLKTVWRRWTSMLLGRLIWTPKGNTDLLSLPFELNVNAPLSSLTFRGRVAFPLNRTYGNSSKGAITRWGSVSQFHGAAQSATGVLKVSHRWPRPKC